MSFFCFDQTNGFELYFIELQKGFTKTMEAKIGLEINKSVADNFFPI